MSVIGYRLEELLPHAGPMLLLDEVLAVDGERIRARTTARRDGLFTAAREPGVPAWMGMEYLAQAIAAWSGYRELEQGNPVRPGFLVGARTFHSSVGTIPADVVLTVEAERLMEDRAGIGVFDGHVSGEGVEQTSRIKVYLPADIEAYLKEMTDD